MKNRFFGANPVQPGRRIFLIRKGRKIQIAEIFTLVWFWLFWILILRNARKI